MLYYRLIFYDIRRYLNLTTLTYLQALILGIVQGLGEFLPISSSGHLAVIQYFFGIEGESVLLFAVMLHLGTLISVFIIYWHDIVKLVKELIAVIKDIFTGKGLRINHNPVRRLGFMIIVATIPTALIGLLFNDIFAGLYLSLMAVGIGFLVTGTILFIAEKMGKNEKKVWGMKFRHAVFIGIMQGIAICPGVSRSGSTLFGGLMSGLDRNFALRFAFLISIPSILGSVILEFPPAISAGLPEGIWGPVIVGTVVSAISGFIAIKAMLKIVAGKRLTVFSWYTWVLGAAVLSYAIFII